MADHHLFEGHRQYRLHEAIGEGGQAMVYRVWDKKWNKERAIKILTVNVAKSEALRKRFQQEALLMARLEHPNILRVIDVGEVDDPSQTDPEDADLPLAERRPLKRPFIVMELMERGSLFAQVCEHGGLSPRELVEITIDLMRALGYAHQGGVVHRDVKPANIMIDHHGVRKLGDFGIAHLDKSKLTNTMDGSAMGSMLYMAPEQFKRASQVDHRADIYAVGTTMWTLARGHGHEPPPSFFAVCKMRPELLKILPEPLRAIIIKATQAEPKDRFQSTEEMIEALLALPAMDDFVPELVTHRLPDKSPPSSSPGIAPSYTTPFEGIGVMPGVNPGNGGMVSDVGGPIPMQRPAAAPRPPLVPPPVAAADDGDGPPRFTHVPLSGRPSNDTVLPSGELHGGELAENTAAPRRLRLTAFVALALALVAVLRFGAFQFLIPSSGEPVAPAPKVVVAPQVEETVEAVEEFVGPVPVAEDPEPVEEPKAKTKAKTTTSKPRTPRPPPALEPEAAPQIATVTASGDAEAVWLRSSAGVRVELGSIPPGSYQIYAIFGGKESVAGAVSAKDGEQITIRCASSYKSCQPKR